MIGAPVRMLARAHARWIFSTFSVTPAASAAHFRNAARIPVPWMPCLDVADEMLRHRVDVAVLEVVREVVVAVDPRAREDAHAGLLGDPLHEAHVAAAEHRRGVEDALHPALLRRADGLQGGVELGLLVISAGPLHGDRLVTEAHMLVNERDAEILGLCRALHSLNG